MSDARDRTIGSMLQAQHRQEAKLVRLEAVNAALVEALEEMLAAKNSIAAVTARKKARAAIALVKVTG